MHFIYVSIRIFIKHQSTPDYERTAKNILDSFEKEDLEEQIDCYAWYCQDDIEKEL